MAYTHNTKVLKTADTAVAVMYNIKKLYAFCIMIYDSDGMILTCIQYYTVTDAWGKSGWLCHCILE